MRIDAIKNTIVAVLCCAAIPSAFAAEGVLSLGTGFNYSSGNYGTATTSNTTSVPLLVKYEADVWTFKLTVPYLYVSGGTSVIPGLGAAPNSNPRSRGAGASTSTVQGLGDVVAAATYAAYYDNASRLGIDLTGRVKLGTADRDQGLGTGENDYSAQIDVFKGYGKVTLFGGVGYNLLGSSAYVKLNNVFNVTVGASYKLDDATTAGLSYDAREKVAASASPLSEMTAFVSHKLDKRWKAQAYLLKGFESGSPDWGAGATVNYAF